MFPNVGPLELVVVLVIALVVLGPKKLPEVGRSLGKGIREFKDSISGESEHDDDQPRALTATEHDATPVTPDKAQPAATTPHDDAHASPR